MEIQGFCECNGFKGVTFKNKDRRYLMMVYDSGVTEYLCEVSRGEHLCPNNRRMKPESKLSKDMKKLFDKIDWDANILINL